MPSKGRWKFRRSSTKEDTVEQDLLQQHAREYMLDGENVYLLCERCEMPVRENAKEQHDFHEHGLYPLSIRTDPTRREYEAGLQELAKWVNRGGERKHGRDA